jgi:hypothetical protein
MGNMLAKLENIRSRSKGYWGDRILAELDYAYKLSKEIAYEKGILADCRK